MNRRIKILYYWLFKNKAGIKISELYKFLKKPKVKSIGSRYITNISYFDDFIMVSFHRIGDKLYWPRKYNINNLYQVSAEIFDTNDWHYYEYKTTKVFNDDIVLDLGAAEGLFSLSIIKRCKKVIIIEPNNLFYHALEKTFRKYIPRKVELFKYAVGDKDSVVELSDHSISSSIIEVEGGNVKMTTLDDLLYNKGRITYIKADLEGYEMKMLKGASHIIQDYRPKMAISCYHQENDYRKIINLVKELVPKYKYHLKGITHYTGKPVMIHFWIPDERN